MKKVLYLFFLCLVILIGCNQKNPVKTIENLKTGIIAEVTASAKYAAFADKARAENHEAIAKLFTAVSRSESIHAFNHRRVLSDLGKRMEVFKPSFEIESTMENLQTSIDGETYETNALYPSFLRDARLEMMVNATKSLSWANNTELKHLVLFQTALSALENGTENKLPMKYAVCPVCGNTYDYSLVIEKCSFCDCVVSKFIVI